MNHQLVLPAVFGALAALALLLGALQRPKRLFMFGTALLFGGAAAAAYVDAFWPMVLLAACGLWTAFASTEVVDLSWRIRAGLTGVICSLAFLVLWPTLSNATGGKLPCPAYIQDKVDFRLIAGLDLRGGLRLVYTVDVDEAIKDKRDHYYEDMRLELSKVFGLHQGDEVPPEGVFQKLREKVDIEAPRRPANAIRLVVKEGTDPGKIDQRFLDRFRNELGYVRTSDLRSYQFEIRSTVESQIRERAVGQAREIILRRVDELGLREAAISTRDEDIIIEVPGEDEKSFATIRDIISKTARLEFKLLDDETDFFGEVRANLQGKEDTLPEGLEFFGETAPVGLDEQGETQSRQLTYALLKKGDKATMQQTLQRFREWVSTLPVPPDREIGFETEYRTIDEETLKQQEYGYRTYLLKSRAEVTGDMIRDASAVPDQSQGTMGGWYVAITFTDQGGRLFERITAANIKRRFAIILDGRIESAPVIQSRIPGGHAQITLGSADPETQIRDARQLELVLRSGALPAPISPSNEQRIGPSLGRDAIDLGVQGAIGGTFLVLLFMLIYYQRAGIIADVAVVMNLFLQISVLTMFGASMTLPGIAALALTVGMSVDNNVLINERIREEMRAGKNGRAAVETGYKRALTAIIDGQLTTVIAGVVLAQYGTGPLKGFAITLIVGTTCGIFTSVVVSRLLFELWLRFLGRQGRLDMG
ncbi:MAG TPA: protein translocase subunit SecD [Polyangiaceae bacterium]|nr:protein translocase subunit SecD [Polyangiaceae bacterium]